MNKPSFLSASQIQRDSSSWSCTDFKVAEGPPSGLWFKLATLLFLILKRQLNSKTPNSHMLQEKNENGATYTRCRKSRPRGGVSSIRKIGQRQRLFSPY